MNTTKLLLTTCAALFITGSALADTVTPIEVPQLPLAKVTFPNGKKMDLTVGYASGATHFAGDDASIIYTITDRGPNIHCDEAKDLIGLDTKTMCAGHGSDKIFPVKDFTPSIYKWSISPENKATLLDTIPLKGTDGHKLNGISNPLTKNPTEKAYDVNGKEFAQSPDGYDSEALVKLSDGTFWISDEYSPSISHVAANGVVLDRLVPKGVEGDYAKASYPVHGILPAIIMKRQLNRGIESIAVSPDEKSLYFSLQSPLANPDKATYKKSRTVRMFKFDIASQKVVGEYAYELDLPDTFKLDSAKKPRKQNNVKISEMVATGNDKLLVLERISKTTKLYEVDLSKGTTIPAKFDDFATTPTLEALKTADLAAAKVVPLTKTLAFSTDDHKGLPSKIEGVAMINPTTLILATDNDFGIAGDPEVMVKVTLDKALPN